MIKGTYYSFELIQFEHKVEQYKVSLNSLANLSTFLSVEFLPSQTGKPGNPML